MKFLIDENLPGALCKHLETLTGGQHVFIRVGKSEVFTSGLLDVELFHRAKAEGVQAVITGDTNQLLGLDRQHERAACRDNGLHWVGIPQQPRATGRQRPTGQISQVLLGFNDIIRRIAQAETPQAFLLEVGPRGLPYAKGYPQDL